MATAKTEQDRLDLGAVDLVEVNKRAAEAGVAALEPSNGPAREGKRLADATPARDK